MRHAKSGFTLAELLIALALLGIIAALTIPKLLQNTANAEAGAKVKEAVATLEQAWYAVKMRNQFKSGAKLYDSIIGNTAADANLNVTASSTGDPAATGSPFNGLSPAHPCGGSSYLGWAQFANGVIMTGMSMGGNITPDLGDASATTNSNSIICIDYNGASGQNRAGVDVFYGNFNYSGQFVSPTTVGQGNSKKPNFFWGSAGNGNIVYTAAGGALTGTGDTTNTSAASNSGAIFYLNQ